MALLEHAGERRRGARPPIDELLDSGRTLSFEFFPPKNEGEHRRLADALVDLQPLEPSFVSVTYRGGRSSRSRTVELVTGMLRATRLTPMPHLTCADHTRLELVDILVELRKAGIENLMALGGDPSTDPDAMAGELRFAEELVELARAVGGFSIGVAAHPAGHPRAADLETDRDRLAAKLRRADFAITQFFFDVDDWVRLVDDLQRRGVTSPVIPGIMPVTSLASVPRLEEMGAKVPRDLIDRLEAARTDEDARCVGLDAVTELCADLLDAGAPGLHFYTLNRAALTLEVCDRLGLRELTAAR
jgi:methylenetetrahydrofolate reductase (NADPH)